MAVPSNLFLSKSTFSLLIATQNIRQDIRSSMDLRRSSRVIRIFLNERVLNDSWDAFSLKCTRHGSGRESISVCRLSVVITSA